MNKSERNKIIIKIKNSPSPQKISQSERKLDRCRTNFNKFKGDFYLTLKKSKFMCEENYFL